MSTPTFRGLLPDGSLPEKAKAHVDAQVDMRVQESVAPYLESADDSATTATNAASTATAARDAAQAAAADVEARAASLATTTTGKNLFNAAAATLNAYWANAQSPTPLALTGWQASEQIPVTPGDYTIQGAGTIALYAPDGTQVPTSWRNVGQAATTVTIPATGVAAIGVSTPDAYVTQMQVERGTAATAYEPFRRILDPAIAITTSPSGPLRITRSGDLLTLDSTLGAQGLSHDVSLAAGPGQTFNFRQVRYGGTTIGGASDDVAPLNTQMGNVGANHGFFTDRWAAGTHDKTSADLGSVWTDGTNEYILLGITSGHLFAGRKYYTAAGGERAKPAALPLADLNHVAGATNTAPLALASRTADQLYPWIQRRRIAATIDGRDIPASGSTTGHELLIRETYEVLDYAEIYDWMKANPGQPYTATTHTPALGIETTWRIRAGGKVSSHTRLWEVLPTRLESTTFYQAEALLGSVTRYLPGVKPIGGLDWSAGVPLAQLTADVHVTTADLKHATMPPTVSIDARPEVGFALGINPWVGEGALAKRLASTPSSLWYYRGPTKKVYPKVVGVIAPGWGQMEAAAVRAYLTPAEVATLTGTDPATAWAALAQLAPA